MGELFGTDGVRGEANQDITAELAFKLGKAGAHYLTDGKEAKVLIGKDTRVSGDMLEAALVAGITSLGFDVIKVGVVPTPVVAYLTRKLDVAAGVMISASHNPACDNGIKFFDQDGFKLSDQDEDEIEDVFFNQLDELPVLAGDKVGMAKSVDGYVKEYIDYIQTTVDNSFAGLKIVVDTANGAACEVSPQVLSQLGAKVVLLNDTPTGTNINVESGSTHPEVVQEAVVERGADLGIAHDGDADRVIAVDEKGQLVDGDYILAICSRQLIKEGKLADNKVVATKYSNLGLHQSLEEVDGEVVVTKNGDRYVLAKMQEKGYNLGGEKSGHIIFLDYNTTGDGLLTALQLIDVVQKTGQPLSKLRQQMEELPQLLVNVEVESKAWEANKKIQEAITEVEKTLEGEGRIFVRASGTEPVIRIMVEGQNKNQLEELANDVAEVVKKELN
ncbi:phosphoglucosamine mutase [Halobacteroides halobius DSM 5150]|uniref:Phosphoglucosamine mutase n=1 Tax=Halobacteroides halobius (strain ATCC 35273 / DSM 5150 / MD-1) TaxID=748449 RepID=L0K4X0_HALHC|nr:phosphoglucosamine mutase [Halobacteroides halobius]AGB40292.1 phosphoglucosamine mutase [Halobacteroides halobius DSM 5150]